MKITDIVYYAFSPRELRSIVQWIIVRNPVHERDENKETDTLKKCFHFLDMTSRSFSTVIKELHPELLVPICLFYLILRGLDTIEDDMTIPLDQKTPLLHDFDKILDKDGWNFDGNGPKEKDRDLLVQFDCVIEELKKVKPDYCDIIKDITKKMGDGMADYARNAEHTINGVDSIKDYELYCHYVAGLVGEGLTRLFVTSGLSNPVLLQRPYLHESMGQFLQQVNIIRDIREDLDDSRRFWPKEVWSKYVTNFEDLLKPENEAAALNCSSEMILIALSRVDMCLFYLAGLKDQSVFNFSAIPQSMAIATLELCFRNPDIFKKNIKIKKGHACRLMLESTQNLQTLYEVFRRYVRMIHKKNDPTDPNFLNISISCGKIEQFIESIFPSQVPTARDALALGGKPINSEEATKKSIKNEGDYKATFHMLGAMITVLAVFTIFTLAIAWIAGARFDIAFRGFLDLNAQPSSAGESFRHGEL